MKSSVAYFIGLLSVIQGFQFSNALDFDAHVDPCVAKIISCDWYRKTFSLYEEYDIGMFTTIEKLEKACREQIAYIRCLARAKKFCEKATLLPLAEEMIMSRRFTADVCRPSSPWQLLYLHEASCLNAYSRRSFMLCIHKIIGFDDLNPDNTFEQGCKFGRAVIDCSAATLQKKCGYYGGIILKKYLKFHSFSEYKCNDIKAEDYPLAFTQNYDMTETIFNILEAADFDNDAILGKGSLKNVDFREAKPDNLDSQDLSDNSLLGNAIIIFYFDDESSTKADDSLSDSLDSDAKSKDITIEPDKFEFPALPKYHYIHKNRTTFALYEDLETGYVKYIGCGEADFFWVIHSPLRNKYCILTDLKSEYTEGIFKCTVHIDAACSPELDDKDRNKNAEVFHRRYVATVLTPPNNQRADDMAIMNVHYLKIDPSPSMYVPEKKVNLWTAQANKNTVKKEPVSRKGSLELENDSNDILYQHGNGQKRDNVTRKYQNYFDEYYEYKNLDYPLEDEGDIYFPELLRNEVIYIEDDKGDLMSVHDPRSPIYSNSLYQPHSLFRPRIGAMPASTDSQELDEDATIRKKKLIQSSIFKERISEFKDRESFSKLKYDQQEYCSEEVSCLSNTESLEFGTNPRMYIEARNIKTFDPLKGMNLKTPPRIQSSTKINEGTVVKSHLDSMELYIVRPSAKIKIPKFTVSSHSEELYKYEFAADRPSCLYEEEIWDDTDITDDLGYFNSDYSSTLKSAPDSEDFQTKYMKPFSYELTQSPYTYFGKSTDTQVTPKTTLDSEHITAEKSSENEKWEERLVQILDKVLKTLFKEAEKFFGRESFDEFLFALLERAEPIFIL